MKIVVAGSGFVGLSNALLLSLRHEVTIVDIDPQRVHLVNSRQPTVKDPIAEIMMRSTSVTATMDSSAYASADYVFIATPTDYDVDSGSFDTSSIESVLDFMVGTGSKAIVVIRSTIPVGYVRRLQAQYPFRVVFCPEFLREGSAMHDTLRPSRIIIGTEDVELSYSIRTLLTESLVNPSVPVQYMGNNEAEAVKLFSNTYLAMRVAFFNELDTYAIMHKLNSKDMIRGVCMDTRIGSHYNNPSFGYGGYCLPKDTKQLLANFSFPIPVRNSLVSAIISSNTERFLAIAEDILSKSPTTVGVFSFSMKSGSDNSRYSAMYEVVKMLQTIRPDLRIIINDSSDLDAFKQDSDLILANRMDPSLQDVAHKVYTRDLFGNDS